MILRESSFDGGSGWIRAWPATVTDAVRSTYTGNVKFNLTSAPLRTIYIGGPDLKQNVALKQWTTVPYLTGWATKHSEIQRFDYTFPETPYDAPRKMNNPAKSKTLKFNATNY